MLMWNWIYLCIAHTLHNSNFIFMEICQVFTVYVWTRFVKAKVISFEFRNRNIACIRKTTMFWHLTNEIGVKESFGAFFFLLQRKQLLIKFGFLIKFWQIHFFRSFFIILDDWSNENVEFLQNGEKKFRRFARKMLVRSLINGKIYVKHDLKW